MVYAELATIKDMDIDLTGLAHVSKVLSMLKHKNDAGGNLLLSKKAPLRASKRRKSSNGHQSLQRSMSAKDLVTGSSNSAFVRGMQDLTQRLFGTLGSSNNRLLSPTAKVTPHELVSRMDGCGSYSYL